MKKKLHHTLLPILLIGIAFGNVQKTIASKQQGTAEELINRDTTYSALGKSSASLYQDKMFEYITPEGSTFIFSVNSDGVSVTLEQGQANNVRELIIPNAVNALGSSFFVSAIADFAFSKGKAKPMAGVKKLILSEGIESVGQNCFDTAEDLEEVIIPTTIKNLSYFMFGGCKNLKSVVIPQESQLTVIEDFAFNDCQSLNSFYIPASVREIKEGPWRSCKSLSELSISEYNYNFHIYEGVLYSGNRKHLIQYPAGKKDKEYYVRYGARTIDNSAFYGNDYISKVTFPASLDSISHIAFYGCGRLEDVIFTDIVEFIGNSAFRECPKLKSIALYGHPNYTYEDRDGYYNTFEPYIRINISENAPKPYVIKSNGSILERVWLTVVQLPYFQEVEMRDNEEYGFPQYFGHGRSMVYGNADPKEDILKLLEVIPDRLFAYENIDKKDRITRVYVDYKNEKILYFKGGIGGNDLIIALFDGGDNKKVKEFMKELNRHQKR